MAQWEYWTTTIDPELSYTGGTINQKELAQILRDADANGWELVTSFATSQTAGNTKYVMLIFRRPIGARTG